jgi:hypothetical protein
VREHRQLLHKENELLVDDAGNGIAILTQGPAGLYPDLIDAFAQLRATYISSGE